MNWISKLLEKRKIGSVNELSPDERQTVAQWERILSKGDITVDTIAKFCENQIKRIEVQWKDLDNSEKKNERLIVQHTVYSTLLNVIKAPALEKEALEKHLAGLIAE